MLNLLVSASVLLASVCGSVLAHPSVEKRTASSGKGVYAQYVLPSSVVCLMLARVLTFLFHPPLVTSSGTPTYGSYNLPRRSGALL